MTTAWMRLLCLSLLLFPTMVCAGPLDDYYLARFAPQVKSAQKEAAGEPGEHRHGEHCRTMLLLSLRKDWDSLEPATRQVLGKQLSRPVLANEASFSSAHFTIFYATTGADAPVLTDGDGDGAPDYVEQVAAVFEEVYSAEVTGMGYRPPPVSGTYKVYLRDLAGEQVYGYATTVAFTQAGGTAITSYIEMDRAYTDPLYGYRFTPLQNLQVTAAHEFHHAIQFGYNYYADTWYMEATATWIEDEVYDSVNQLYDYLNSYLSRGSTVSLDAGLGNNTEYGRWLFNRYLAERHSPTLVREVWEDLGTKPRPVGSVVIPMLSLIDAALVKRGSSVGTELAGMAGALFLRDWSTHTTDTRWIPHVEPVTTSASYPTTSASAPSSTLVLPRYTFAFYEFLPGSSAPENLKLVVGQVADATTVVAYRRGSDGSITSYPLDRQKGLITVPSFGSDPESEVRLLVTNGSASGQITVAFSTEAGTVTLPTLTLNFAGTGGGAVNGDISCTSGSSCAPAEFAPDGTVTLLATPDTNSTFGGWSAPCTVSGNSCQLTVTSDTTVTSTFIAAPKVKILGGASYSSVGAAYAAAGSSATIHARNIAFEDAILTLNRPIEVSLFGGYDAAFASKTGLTALQGKLLVRNGTLRVNGVALR